jgi:hypothetical protein
MQQQPEQKAEEIRRDPAQAEGPDEEAEQGLEQQAQVPQVAEGAKGHCWQDKGGVVH